jgi:hypothetical protein
MRIAILAFALTIPASTNAALLARDFDGNFLTAEGFYSTALNVTWLADGNYAGTIGFLSGGIADGTLTLNAAINFANSASIGGFSNWRLPKSDMCEGYGCTESEMGFLFHQELALEHIPNGSNADFSPFHNVLFLRYYWSSTPFLTGAMRFAFDSGAQAGQSDPNAGGAAWLVHDGDIGAPVPVPSSALLFLSAIGGIALSRRLG